MCSAGKDSEGSTSAGDSACDERRSEASHAERDETAAVNAQAAQREHAGEASNTPQSSQREKIERIKAELNHVPTLPGVYLWKDATGSVIYVGKAKQLRARMRQYVNFQDERAKIPLLVNQIESFDYIVVENEHEALVLEHTLINQYAPFFNADFKDDKSYPFIALTKSSTFPAIKYTREKHKSDVKYFGPFTESRAAREMVDIARRVVPVCAATCDTWRKMDRKLRAAKKQDESSHTRAPEALKDARPCFDCHVGLAPGACCGKITPKEYSENIKRIERFLAGNHTEFVRELTQDMQVAAQNLDFERAARIKSRIDVINSLSLTQHVVSARNLNADVIGIYREFDIAGVTVLMVREGRVINSNEFILNKGKNVPDSDLTHNFLLKYYATTTNFPHIVIMSGVPEDAPALEQWLTEKLDSAHGARVHFVTPARGERQDLLEMSQKNARCALLRYKVRNNYDDKRINKALMQLESALALDSAPLRIECFDISTIHGSYTVASMVVFTNGAPDKNQYRRFKIKTPLDEANDFLCMAEVMQRRYSPERLRDENFGSKPDLIILDGGKPQLTAALEMFDEMGVHDIAICGLAKRDEEIFVPWKDDGPIVLPSGSESLYLVKQVRDEAHRFAITYHRQLRQKGMTKSILDEVAGLGPVRKKAILKHFKSFKNLRAASLEQIEEAKILPQDVARELYTVLQQYNGGAGGRDREEACAGNSGQANKQICESVSGEAAAFGSEKTKSGEVAAFGSEKTKSVKEE